MTSSNIFIWIVTFLVIILFELISSYQHSAENTASTFRVKVTYTFNVVAVSFCKPSTDYYTTIE